MEKKKKRYEIESKVRVPNMDEIQLATSDFNEAAVHEEQNHDFIARNAKHLVPIDDNDIYNPQLNNIKKEMLQLAMAVASEETDIKKSVDAAVSADGSAKDSTIPDSALEDSASRDAESRDQGEQAEPGS